jgi:hypothetical protein
MTPEELKKLATSLLTETLHGPIPTKTTMTLAEGIVEHILTHEQRGLVIISVLMNFVDWLDKENVIALSPKDRAGLVKLFLETHSGEKNYFLCAEDIAERLGVPFK